MQPSKYIDIDNQFGLTGILHPMIGGPAPAAYPVYGHGVTFDGLRAKIAKTQIEYAAPRPFDSLNLRAVNEWEVDRKKVKKWIGGEPPEYSNSMWRMFYPPFIGDGIIYRLVGAHNWRGMPDDWQMAVWSAIDYRTEVRSLLEIVKGLYRGNKFEHHKKWRLLYILRTSWKATDPKFRGYDIYVPPKEWLEAHGVS